MKQILVLRHLALVAVIALMACPAFAINPSCESIFESKVESAKLLTTSEKQTPKKDLFHASAKDLAFYEAEFSRKPDDSLNGQVTDKVPLTVPAILAAYKRGLFPWKVSEDGNGIWFNPPKRGILYIDNPKMYHEDRSTMAELYKKLAKGGLTVTFDTAFRQVMEGCRDQKRAMRDPNTNKLEQKIDPATGKLVEELQATWIKPEFIDAYVAMFEAGHGHSLEVWKDGKLVGGTYGVLVEGMFTGESMFHTEKNVAKLAFDVLLKHLQSRGITRVDTQVAPEDSKSLTVKWGAYEVTRDEYMQLLSEHQKANITWK